MTTGQVTECDEDCRAIREPIENIHVEGRRWFDRINGNTYCSAAIYVDGECVAIAPFQYGYGDFYIQAAQEALEKLGTIPTEVSKWGSHRPLWQICNDLGINLTNEVKDVLKRDLHGDA